MEEIIKSFVGQEVDINCGGTSVFRGSVIEADGEIVKLRSEDNGEVVIALDKITAVSKVQNGHHRPGFVV